MKDIKVSDDGHSVWEDTPTGRMLVLLGVAGADSEEQMHQSIRARLLTKVGEDPIDINFGFNRDTVLLPDEMLPMNNQNRKEFIKTAMLQALVLDPRLQNKFEYIELEILKNRTWAVRFDIKTNDGYDIHFEGNLGKV
jgi:hypothetical protein